MLAGICISMAFWWRLARRDARLLYVYFGALGGAFFGAKIVYLAAEGWLRWHDANRWLELATGKTILGGLLGGYLGVEITKKLVGYKLATGDWFALIAPVAITLGRVGCWFHGCCRGVQCPPAWYSIADAHGTPRWPSVQTEMLFNLIALLAIVWLNHKHLFQGQRFHLYLIAYGLFRFGHEFLREEPRVLGRFSGYQIAALAVAGLGLWGFFRRKAEILKAETDAAERGVHAASMDMFAKRS
jgi:phosphatidylglycerol:prolipoprotein diacylglycerol transferase